MTDHTKEDIEALILVARKAASALFRVGLNGDSTDVEKVLAKFAPKPAKVYVIPSWNDFFKAHRNTHFISLTKAEYEQVRELTATEAPAQKWNMPPLQQINEICGQPYGTAPTNALDTWYEAIRNKIMGL